MNIALIPGRMAATRFPGKPLAKIAGIPMIGHVYLRSKMSRRLDEVYVATCDLEIKSYIESIGGKAIMTKDTHERASDRCAEALSKAEKQLRRKAKLAVMIQGDEPLVTPQMIDAAISAMEKDKSIQVANLVEPIETQEDQEDPNEIKVVVDQKWNALYFSRGAIPSWAKAKGKVPMYKQVCIIPFRRDYLFKFNRLKSTILEQVESIDMLRVLEHGEKVRMVPTPYRTCSVDTPADLKLVSKIMQKDSLFKKYRDQA